MDLGIRGRVALVTASSKGIGRQCALALAAEGARIVLCARTAETLEATRAEVAAVAGADNVHAAVADLSKAADIERLCNDAAARFGKVDICVFIGGSPQRGGFDAITDEHLIEAFELSVLAGMRLARRLLPGMRERRWGRMVTVQSRAVREPIPQLLTSAATRPGVAGLFKYLSNEAAADGVLINTIVPGRINTERFHKGAAMAAGGTEAYIKGKLGELPIARLGEAQEIADAVCFLVSERASYINGASLQVDGGAIKAS